MAPHNVFFACVHNAGRSQMAAALFNDLADPAKARRLSAGTKPGTAVHPEVPRRDAGSRHRPLGRPPATADRRTRRRACRC